MLQVLEKIVTDILVARYDQCIPIFVVHRQVLTHTTRFYIYNTSSTQQEHYFNRISIR